MKKTEIFWYIIDSIFLLVFNLYFFQLKGGSQPTSVWISYSSIHISYMMLLITPYLFKIGRNYVDFSRPIYAITTIYFFISLIVGVVFVILSQDSYTLALLAQITVIAIFTIILLTNLIINDRSVKDFELHENEIKYVKEASSKIKTLLNQITDNSNRKKVEKLLDLLNSSQVKSSNFVKSIEEEIIREIDNIEKAISQENFDNIQTVLDKVCNLANERNRLLKLSN